MEDTIVAISTPLVGESGIGIVRMSGKDTTSIADRIFVSKDNKKVSEFNTFTVHYGWVVDAGNQIIDEVLLTVMYAPKTYTRENIVEISCHGGQVVLQKVLKLCIEYGARLAEPGEFTKRAFLNGRIDLIQAEAICDLIRSKTDESAIIAAQQVKGILSDKINIVKTKILNLVARIEVIIDHPEEDIECIQSNEFTKITSLLINDIDKLCDTAQKGKMYRNGIKIAIVGKPNVGKSSLLNRLLSEERAIVTSFPGTTRDIITESFNLRGIPITIMDTAGIRAHYRNIDYIEKLANEKSESAINNAQIIIFLCDISSNITDDDKLIAEIIHKACKKSILVLNKIDLLKNTNEVVQKYLELANGQKNLAHCAISVLQNKGIDELQNMLYNLMMGNSDSIGAPDTTDSVIITNLRHELLLRDCKKNLEKSIESIDKNESPEFVVIHLKHALDNLGKIVGFVTTEDILDEMFSTFCIGK